jgi:ketosteroid isomerase-like protein
MSHENIERVRNGYAAFSAGDLDKVRELLAPDVIWRVPGDTPISGEYKGIDEVFGFFGKLLQETGGTFKLEVRDILANDHRAAILAHQSSQRNGKSLDGDVVHVMEINAAGQTTEFCGYVEDSKPIEEFWA